MRAKKKNSRYKLTPQQIEDIIAISYFGNSKIRYLRYPGIYIAALFGISSARVSQILSAYDERVK